MGFSDLLEEVGDIPSAETPLNAVMQMCNSFSSNLVAMVRREVSAGTSGCTWPSSASPVCWWPVRTCSTTLSRGCPPTTAACQPITVYRPITACRASRWASAPALHWFSWFSRVKMMVCSRLMRSSCWEPSSPGTLRGTDWTAAGGNPLWKLCPPCSVPQWHHFLPRVFLRFVEPQWHLLAANSSANVSHLQTEECLDGWTFDSSEFLATTVSEVLKPPSWMVGWLHPEGVKWPYLTSTNSVGGHW